MPAGKAVTTPVESPWRLEPLPYHVQLRDFLKSEESDIWNWFASNQVRADQADSVRFELLKSTYRVDRDSQPDWYALAEQAAERLKLDVPITIYQAQNPQGLNASLAYLPGEAHIVLAGPVGEKLQADELLSIFAHELSHLLLWQNWDGEFLIVDQILAALTNDRHAEPPHFASARLFDLYKEVFCDRGALFAAQDPHVVVAALVKVVTGLESVNAHSYIKQAEEIFARPSQPSQSLTHPEAFIRARSVQLWHDQANDTEAQISAMLEGPLVLDELDLLGQVRVSQLTRRLLTVLLARPWLQTEAMLGHARLFFEDFTPPRAGHVDEALTADLRSGDQSLIDYYCYLLLDFVTADRDLEESPLAAALLLAESLQFKPRLLELVRKELKLRKTQLDKIDKQKEELIARAEKEFARS